MMYKYLLVPLDGSRFSEYALSPALQMAKGMGIPIVLLHSVDASTIQPDDVVREHLLYSIYDYNTQFQSAINTTLPDQKPEYRTSLDNIIESKSDLAERYLLRVARALQAESIEVERTIELEPAPDAM